MNTTYPELYERFLFKVRDYDMKDLDPAVLDKRLLLYLQSALSKFDYCKQDLTQRDDAQGLFLFSMSDKEKEIISLLMVIEWLDTHIRSQELLKQTIGSKDYQFFSSANQLDKMLNLRKAMKSEIDQEVLVYYYHNYGGE